MPPWLPKTRLYVGLGRWGIEAAAAVVEARVAEQGGVPQEESLKDRADRFARFKDLERQRALFQNSDAGVKAATAAYEEFSIAIEAGVKAMSSAGVQMETNRSSAYRIITGLYPCNAIAGFSPRFINSLDEAPLEAAVYKGFPNISGYNGSRGEARKLWSERYSYELVRPDTCLWVNSKGREFTSLQLADHFLKVYLDVAENKVGLAPWRRVT